MNLSSGDRKSDGLSRLNIHTTNFDYLIGNGSLALYNPYPLYNESGLPFVLDATRGRMPIGLRFQATMQGDDVLSVNVTKTSDIPQSVISDLIGLFLRAAFRRVTLNEVSVEWPEIAPLRPDDPLSTSCTFIQGKFAAVLSSRLLRPRRRQQIRYVYTQPADVPWNYRPLDYDVLSRLTALRNVKFVLDLGCGIGRNAVPLENAGFAVYGVDLSLEAIKSCQFFVEEPTRFVVASALGLPYASESFDAVVDVGCLHMILKQSERRRAIAEVARVLKPGGALVSRLFKPRSAEWVSNQPFLADRFGIEQDEIIQDLQGSLTVEEAAGSNDVTYIRVSKP